MSQNPAPVLGQVSADGQFRWDGQQWTPIPKGEREPTPWTRPMQLTTAALFVVQAVYGVVTTLIFVNHDSILKSIKAQGTSIPAGTDINTIVNISIGFTIAIVVVIAILSLLAALGSALGWRWMFWVALILFGLGGISGLGNIRYFGSPDQSPLPLSVIAFSEVFSLANLALFVWLLVGAVKFGPWAMKKPGS